MINEINFEACMELHLILTGCISLGGLIEKTSKETRPKVILKCLVFKW